LALVLLLVIMAAVIAAGVRIGDGQGRKVAVQNMVAVGPAGLVEDATASYLSTQPLSRCAARCCKILGSDLFSGDEIVVDCTVRSAVPLTNADFGLPGIDSTLTSLAPTCGIAPASAAMSALSPRSILRPRRVVA
jgi:hypothetical protein